MAVAGVPGSSVVFFAQGEKEIIVWDVAALLALDRIETDAVPKFMVVARGKLFCALEDGVIDQISLESYEVECAFDAHAGKEIVRMRECGGRLYSVLEGGAVFLWEDGGHATELRGPETGVRDCLVAPGEKDLIIVVDDRVLLGGIELTGGDCTCCCVDSVRPLLAIGGADGSIAVWRLPVS
jgi:hypothetical protein